MKPFLFDPSITNSLDVARRDYMEYFVEDILGHRGKHQRTHVEFLVKWLNYPSDKNTWEPYSRLRDVDKLHDYLRHNNMTKLINKQHRCLIYTCIHETLSMRILSHFFYLQGLFWRV